MRMVKDAYDSGFIDGMRAAAAWAIGTEDARNEVEKAIPQRKFTRYYCFREVPPVEEQPE